MQSPDLELSPIVGSFLPQEATSRIAFALSKNDKKLFFSDVPQRFSPDECKWLHEPDMLTELEWENLLVRTNPEVLVTGWSTPALPVRWIQQKDCSLRYVCHLGGSTRRIVPRLFLQRKGLVTNWGNSVGHLVAEQALLLALAALRNQKAWKAFMALPLEERPIATVYCATRSLFGRRVGVHGFGSVARALLKLLKPFGVTISAYSDGVPVHLIETEGVHASSSLEELFSHSDVIFECEALTEITRGCVTASLLGRLPDGAVYVNVARGDIAEENALMAEASSGRIRLALDVISDEPFRMDSPICQQPNAVISPHIGGPTFDRYSHCTAIAVKNLEHYIRNEPLEAQVTLESYDRST